MSLSSYRAKEKFAEETVTWATLVVQGAYIDAAKQHLYHERRFDKDRLKDDTIRGAFNKTLQERIIEELKTPGVLVPGFINFDALNAPSVSEEARIKSLDDIFEVTLGITASATKKLIDTKKDNALPDVYNKHQAQSITQRMSRYFAEAQEELTGPAVVQEVKDNLLEPDAVALLDHEGHNHELIVLLVKNYDSMNEGAATPKKLSKSNVEELLENIRRVRR